MNDPLAFPPFLDRRPVMTGRPATVPAAYRQVGTDDNTAAPGATDDTTCSSVCRILPAARRTTPAA